MTHTEVWVWLVVALLFVVTVILKLRHATTEEAAEEAANEATLERVLLKATALRDDRDRLAVENGALTTMKEAPLMIPSNAPDAELLALQAELQRRYPGSNITLRRALWGGTSHIELSIDAHNLNRRRAYDLTTDTAERALSCVEEWEAKLLKECATVPPGVRAYYCLRCGEVISAGTPLQRMNEFPPRSCPKCPGTDREHVGEAEYVLKKADT